MYLLTHLVVNNLFCNSELPQSAAGSRQSQPSTASTSTVQVTLDLYTNWGHNNRIGLTEVQIYSIDGTRMVLRSDQISVQGAMQSKGDLAYIVNGKTKVSPLLSGMPV